MNVLQINYDNQYLKELIIRDIFNSLIKSGQYDFINPEERANKVAELAIINANVLIKHLQAEATK